MPPLSAIVVEDDPFWMSEIVQALTAEGVQVHGAGTGAEALRLHSLHPHAAMVVDIILPDRDGIEVITAIKATAPEVKILAISGGGRLGPDFYLRLATALGAPVTIGKPFTRQAFIARWRTLWPSSATSPTA